MLKKYFSFGYDRGMISICNLLLDSSLMFSSILFCAVFLKAIISGCFDQ